MNDRPPLDLTQLRLLVAVAETGSIGQAARREAISQPAASKRLAQLERAIAIRLVERSTRGSVLTPEGGAVADWSRRVIDTVDDMLTAVAAMRIEHDSDLRIAASMTIAEHLVPEWISDVRKAQPDVHVGLRVANSTTVQELVASGEADLGFVETPEVDASLMTVQVARDELVVVVAPGHPWTKVPSIDAATLATEPLVVREAGSGTRVTLDTLLANFARALPVLELGSNTAVTGAVMTGAGASVLSRLAVGAAVESGRLRQVDVSNLDLHRPLFAIWRHGHPPVGAARTLLTRASTA